MIGEEIKFNQRQISILAALAILLLGLLSGIFFFRQEAILQSQKMANILGTLNSQVVPTIISYGTVTAINGKEITIAFNSDLITIKMKDDAPVHLLYGNASEAEQQNKSLEAVSVGDMLKVDIIVNADGSFEGKSIINFSKK
jgi:preprotein translocase subunit YajC